MLLGGAAGAIAGSSGGGSSHTGATATRNLAAGPASVAVPAAWTTASAAALGGPTLTTGTAAADQSHSGAAIAVGQANGTGSLLLPAAFASQVTGTGEPVKLGKTEALRYRTQAGLTLFAIPTSKDVLVVECTAQVPDATCTRAASTLEPGAATPVSLGPRAAYATALSSAIEAYDRRSDAAASRLHAAKTASAQASAARAGAVAAGGLARAAAAIQTAPLERTANADLVRAAAGLRSAWTELAAASANDSSRYDAAKTAVYRAQRKLVAAMKAIGKLGYTVSGSR